MANQGDPGSKSDASGDADFSAHAHQDGDRASTRAPRGQNDGRDQDLIGQNLRRVYQEVASEPLPDRFKELLDKLKRGES